MFSWIRVFQIVLLTAGRTGRGEENESYKLKDLTCDEFERGNYFDPYQTLSTMWKIFYFWGNTTEIYPIMFNLPDKQLIRTFRQAAEGIQDSLAESFPWRQTALVMDPRPGVQVLLFYTGLVGSFRALVKLERLDDVHPRRIPIVKFTEIRLKMIDRLIGLMACEEETGYALARVNELPKTEQACEIAAAMLGFPKGAGRSYLYVEKLIDLENNEL